MAGRRRLLKRLALEGREKMAWVPNKMLRAYLHVSMSSWSYLLLLTSAAVLLAAASEGGFRSTLRWNEYDEAVAAAEARVETAEARNEAAFREYVSFETISKHPEQYLSSLVACAEFLSSVFADRLGLSNAAAYSSEGFPVPIVVGSSAPFESPKPKVLVYGHYDVQPVDGEWTISEPFEMKRITLEGFGEVYTGRGSQDDKGNTWYVTGVVGATA